MTGFDPFAEVWLRVLDDGSWLVPDLAMYFSKRFEPKRPVPPITRRWTGRVGTLSPEHCVAQSFRQRLLTAEHVVHDQRCRIAGVVKARQAEARF